MAVLLRFSMALSLCLTAHQFLERMDPDYQRNLIPQICSVPAATVELSTGYLYKRELDEKASVILARIAEKREIALEIVAGKTTLLAAAARFQELNQDVDIRQLMSFRKRYQARTDAERHCLEVVAFALAETRTRGHYRQLEQRLLTEVNHLFAGGPLEHLRAPGPLGS